MDDGRNAGMEMADARAEEWYLLHKDIVVAQMNIDSDGSIHHVSINPETREHLPMGAQLNMVRFHEWWQDRAVPRTRQGARTALKKLGYASTGRMLIDNLALSLTDCYWIRPRKASVSWADVNLYENPFVDYFGEITINSNADIGKRSKFSLATSQGEVRKKWIIREGGARAMVKGNWAQSYQQSINEVFATLLHRRQGAVPFTAYELLPLATTHDEQGLGCVCDLFTDAHTEFVCAWEVIRNAKMRGHQSYYLHFKEQCLRHGMAEDVFDRFMSYEILTDILLTNTDRHMNNLGILRDPDTLDWKGFAPIYDCGNAMFFREPDLAHVRLDQIKVSSFLDREKKLLRYVRYPEIVDLNRLPSKEEFAALYGRDILERRVRVDPLWELFQRKVNMVDAFQERMRRGETPKNRA